MKDSTGTEVVTPTELVARCFRGETVSITDGSSVLRIARLGDGRYSVNGRGAHTLEALRAFYGSYHAEFGSAIFWPA